MNYEDLNEINEITEKYLKGSLFGGKAGYFVDAINEALESYSDERIEEMKRYLTGEYVEKPKAEVEKLSKLEIIGMYSKHIF